MIQVDIAWQYAFGALFATAAVTQLKNTDRAWWDNKYFIVSLLFSAILFVPTGTYLLWEFPHWESMQVYSSRMDEFLISMSGISIADAQQRCRDLQSLISDKELKCTIELDKPLTLSIGIAAYTSNCEYELDLIRAADRALYRAKELGKNRIELANSE